MIEKVSIKNEGDRVLSRLPVGHFIRHSRETDSGVIGGVSLIFEIQDFMVVLVTCKNEEDPINNEGFRVLPHYKYIGFFKSSRAAYSAVNDRIKPKFKLV